MFGHSVTETQLSRASSKEIDAEADLAGKSAELEALQVIQQQKTKLTEMETNWKKREAELQAEMKKQGAEMLQQIEAERLKLQRMDVEKEVRIASARATAYSDDSHRSDVACVQHLDPLANPFLPNNPFSPNMGRGQHANTEREQHAHMEREQHAHMEREPHAHMEREQHAHMEREQHAYMEREQHAKEARKTEAAVLTGALLDSITLSRLPAPEPSVYTGDTLQYVRWKTSFKTLIDNKGLSSAERLFYLQRYLGGPALKAVEGFFYNTTEESYAGAWKILDERYGHHFKVQEAFREKLAKWPKITIKDAAGFQEYADFLRACSDAMAQIKGLCILNDCKENQRLASKLPDWAAARWNRQVTQAIEDKGDYPEFSVFVKFVSKEARIACNPITSFGALKEAGEPEKAKEVHGKDKRVNSRYKGTALATGTKETERERPKDAKDSTNDKTTRKCNFCKMDNHYLATCFKFEKQTQQEKKAFIQSNWLCFGCLKVGHRSKDCHARLTCQKCKGRHPTVLHEERKTENPVKETREETKEAPAVSCKLNNEDGTCSTSMIVPVWLSSPDRPTKEVLTYAMLDTQSSSSFILKEVAESVTNRFTPVRLKFSTMTSPSSCVQTEAVSELMVRGMTSNKRITIPVAYTQFIPFETAQIPTAESAQRWPHLKHLSEEMSALQTCGVGLLLGYDCPQALIPRQTIAGKDDEPFAVKTDLGWSIVGGKGLRDTTICHKARVRELPEASPIDALAVLQRDFAETEQEGKMVSQEDLRFLELMNSGVQQTDDGHLKMPLPFRSVLPALPNNKKTTLARLEHLKGKFKRDTNYHKDYKEFMEGMIRDGGAERADGPAEEGQVWYIPHHGVYHAHKPGKIRVVFDCSARHGPVSLNGHLLTGPDLINGLTGVLCRFRQQRVALMCDIEKMFHQFLVNKEHRDYLRFLWWEQGDYDTAPLEYRMKVHLFGAASSPGCANFGLKFLAESHKDELPEAAKFIQRNFYVDDGLQSCKEEKEAISLVKQTQELCKRGGLHLHKFISNSREVLDAIPKSERAPCIRDVDLFHDNLPTERALGIQWNVEADTFTLRNQPMEQTPTRRGILSAIASIYDPLGFVAPFLLTGKTILQETCRKGTDWDELIHDDLLPKWDVWKADCLNLSQIKIPRWYRPCDLGVVSRTELHHFSDASSTGYGQCSYLRFIDETDKVHVAFVSGKARVAPLKMVTIPRLELAAALVSALVSHTLKKELQIPVDEEFFWTDSQVVLSYIANEAKRFHVFVANRVQKIRQLTKPTQWHYVRTEDNPADHASRGLNVTSLMETNWFRGPDFLWKEWWIAPPDESRQLNMIDPEVRKVTALGTSTTKVFDVVKRLERFSKWSLATSAIARLKRMAQGTRSNKSASCTERMATENFIVKSLQGQAFGEEIQTLRKEKTVKGTSPLHSLDPFLDAQGILRVGGRLSKANIPTHTKHPAILPREGHTTTLLIRHFHEKTQHQGRGMTLNEIRQNGYWIIGGTKAVQNCIGRCVTCRRSRRPVQEQKMANLPEDRLEPSPPFTYCGIDCFGPFLVKKGRSEHKRYGLLITCLCCRGIHIEMLEDMSTDSFINALRCFIALRGAVRHIRSDQGSNFIGAKNELRAALKELDHDKIQRFLAGTQCEFVFNAPSSSHAGGVWERQIRTVRSILNVTLKISAGRLDDASLRTFLYEAMAIVNSRPLTVTGVNDPTGMEPLTPNHLLTMKSKEALPPPGIFPKEDLYITKRWRKVQYLCEVFWGRWKREYLSSLNERTKWTVPRRNLMVGDVVLLKDDSSPRMEWPLGLVTEAQTAEDGLVRRVKLTTRATRELERPVQKLVLLIEAK